MFKIMYKYESLWNFQKKLQTFRFVLQQLGNPVQSVKSIVASGSTPGDASRRYGGGGRGQALGPDASAGGATDLL